MSQTDSFIDEVTEEVKRDKLFGYFRRYGWIAILLILILVGGAAWREYSLAQSRSQAEDFGAELITALNIEDPAARQSALSAVAADSSGAKAIRDLLAADQAVAVGDYAAAKDLLNAVTNDNELPAIYQQIARFKFAAQASKEDDAETRRAVLGELNVPGQPLRLLAQEQLVLLDLETGNTDTAIAQAKAILDDAEVSQSLVTRIGQVLAALGVSLDTDTEDAASE